MSVFPPGETNSNVPPWATASRPEQPVSSNADTAAAITSRRMVKAPLLLVALLCIVAGAVKAPPAANTPRQPGGRRRRSTTSPRPVRSPDGADRARGAYRSDTAAASTPAADG
ncbi:Uncharacterised protein [Mycobacterium tuberculosis]|nr:Uncharacterised protein [Mycobacterium tuberculosis]